MATETNLRRLPMLCVASAAWLSASCAVPPAGPAQPPPELSIGAILKHVEPVGQTPITQTRGGVSMTLAPMPFDTATASGCSYEPATGFSLTVPPGVSATTHTRLQEERFQLLEVHPPELTLLLTIRNQMDRVFRGAGAVVQFTVDQDIQAVEQFQYIDFINALIPPNGESQIRMRGPSVAALRDGSTFGVQLFDVVAEMDAAGNVSRRDNFEWYFGIRHETIERTLETIDGRRTVWVPNALAQTILASRRDDPSALPTRVVRPDGTLVRAVTVRECRDLPT